VDAGKNLAHAPRTLSIGDGGEDVLSLEVWVVAQNLGDLDAGGQSRRSPPRTIQDPLRRDSL